VKCLEHSLEHCPSWNSLETGGFQHLRCRDLHLKRLSVTLGRWVKCIFTTCSASEGRSLVSAARNPRTGILGHRLNGERRAKVPLRNPQHAFRRRHPGHPSRSSQAKYLRPSQTRCWVPFMGPLFPRPIRRSPWGERGCLEICPYIF